MNQKLPGVSRQIQKSKDSEVLPERNLLTSAALFAGGGELGSLMREMDWAKTSLGPAGLWPQSLKTCVRVVLTSRQPMFVWWGDELINLYNDAYRGIVGNKHPNALGQPASIVWREIWDQVGPRAASAMQANEGTYDESLMLIMERYGYREETYYTFSYSPVPNDQGGTGGILCANTDNTARIIGERQVALLRDLASGAANARTWREACQLSAESLVGNPRDICFALIYVMDESQKTAELAGATGMNGHPAAPAHIPLDASGIWPVAGAIQSREVQILRNVNAKIPGLPGGAWNESPNTVAVMPLAPAGSLGRPGALVAGLNPCRLPDENYVGFLKLLAGQISAAIGNAEAYEQERRRAESLAEIDRAKTAFFSNVSHEFRTPLTLMLGPLEELLREDRAIPAPGLRQIELAHRNGLRLLKLVNTLLDFSRIEAGRVQAVYRPVDLSEQTSELASVFHSAMERAGLHFTIDCEPLPEPVFVDLDMWEKIVLNLLSNAFKFTLQGEVNLTLRSVGGHAELRVRDTGTGIPESEMPRIFERFHRVEGTLGRTHEGTGIGLALVHELVRLHGGTVEAESELGAGSDFIVRVPFGAFHLPSGRVTSSEPRADGYELGAAPFVQEALRWLPDTPPPEEPLANGMANEDLSGLLSQQGGPRPEGSPRVLLAEDNRDMREYVSRLLSRKFEVTAVDNGAQAVVEALKSPAPDLVLTDVMMPVLDGFGVLHALRSNPATATIPVIMLSARAGEEAESEGLEAGTDDYLVKPFTARELMARVSSHISTHRMRAELAATERELRTKAEAAEQQYRAILESISEGFIFVDRDWRIRYANDQAAEISSLRLSDMENGDLWQVYPGLANSQFGRTYREAMESNLVRRAEEYYAPFGRWIHTNAYPSADGLSIFIQDVTEGRTQQQQLLLSEKLAATGRLAATIAHEINNPLESVLNLIYLARTSNSTNEKVRAYLVTAEKELTRVSHIARHTLGFYRVSSVPTLVDIAALLEEVLTVYESRLRASEIGVERNFSMVPAVRAVRGELHQVFSNLISNAIDAMSEGGGLLRLSTRETRRETARGADPGVLITVGDTGVGIPPEVMPKLYEPFFTTKLSSGTGLGLWVVKEFVESWGGDIAVTTSTVARDHGTTFSIFIPSSTKKQEVL